MASSLLRRNGRGRQADWGISQHVVKRGLG